MTKCEILWLTCNGCTANNESDNFPWILRPVGRPDSEMIEQAGFFGGSVLVVYSFY